MSVIFLSRFIEFGSQSGLCLLCPNPAAEWRSLESFPPCFSKIYISSNLHATSYSFFSVFLYTVKEKGGKPDRKPHPPPYDLRNPYRNLKSENSQDCVQKPQINCSFMNYASDPWTERNPFPIRIRTFFLRRKNNLHNILHSMKKDLSIIRIALIFPLQI